MLQVPGKCVGGGCTHGTSEWVHRYLATPPVCSYPHRGTLGLVPQLLPLFCNPFAPAQPMGFATGFHYLFFVCTDQVGPAVIEVHPDFFLIHSPRDALFRRTLTGAFSERASFEVEADGHTRPRPIRHGLNTLQRRSMPDHASLHLILPISSFNDVSRIFVWRFFRQGPHAAANV